MNNSNDSSSIQPSSVRILDDDSSCPPSLTTDYDPSQRTLRLKVDNIEVLQNYPPSYDARIRSNTRAVGQRQTDSILGRQNLSLPENSGRDIFNFDSRSSELANGNSNDSDTIDV